MKYHHHMAGNNLNNILVRLFQNATENRIYPPESHNWVDLNRFMGHHPYLLLHLGLHVMTTETRTTKQSRPHSHIVRVQSYIIMLNAIAKGLIARPSSINMDI